MRGRICSGLPVKQIDAGGKSFQSQVGFSLLCKAGKVIKYLLRVHTWREALLRQVKARTHIS